ncbi:MAG TPA: hypothetical protein IGR64_12175 [Leptolyngbyaceae cyanobacterium M65_K2018_010]|nr:hypothetical protein [Leptolyngbyaceae cyanobacterium M65_K2018_010]
MLSCPRCQATIEPTTIQCPRCQLTLKAHGHPGIPLHRAAGEEALCTTCRYDADNTCNFPHRPQAQTCTLYRSVHQPLSPDLPPLSPGDRFRLWLRSHGGVVALIGLLLVSLVLVLIR